MKFKVGDKVSVIKTVSGLTGAIGEITQVKETGQHQYLVNFMNTNRWLSEDELALEKEVSKMGDAGKKEDSRGLYEVVVVNPTEDGEIILTEKVVARDEAEAKFVAGVKEILKSKKLRLGDVDIVVNRIGWVRPYETEQKVRVVGSIDGYSLVKTEK